MTAIDLVIRRGEYSHFQEKYSENRIVIRRNDVNHEAYRRFLVRIISRAILDVCMYDKGNPLHDDARRWLLGEEKDALISFRELVELVDLENLGEQIFSVAEEEGVTREKVRDMKKLLYNLGDDDGEGKST